MTVCCKYFVSLLLCTASLRSVAQYSDNYHFKCKTYSTKDGLAHNFTLKCRMDSKGFLWVITQNGLSRFDGYKFENFQHQSGDSTSLPFNELADIAVDQQDRIWLSYANGLCYYDQTKHSFHNMQHPAIALCYDSTNHKIWFTDYKGLFNVNEKTLAVESPSQQLVFPSKPSYINIDSKQRLWISMQRRGYFMYSIKAGNAQYYNNEYWPTNIIEDDGKNIWINTWQSGFQLFDEKDGTNKSTTYRLSDTGSADFIYQDAAQSLPLTGSNVLWVATNTAGVALFDKKERKFIKWLQYDPSDKSGIASNFNSSIYADKNGILWLCTWKGLTKINRQEQQFQSGELPFLKSLADYNLLASIIDDPEHPDHAWLGVSGSGICYYDKIKQQPVKWYFRKSTNEQTNPNYNWQWIFSGIKDEHNNIWYTTYGGLVKIAHGNVTKQSITDDNGIAYPSKIIAGADGLLWMATSRGLIQFDPNTNAYKIHRISNDKKALEVILDIEALNKEEIICGYANIGLYRFNKTSGLFKKIIISPEDSSKKEWTTINALAKAGNSIYAGSSTGLQRYDIATGKTMLLGKEQGILKLDRSSLIKDAAENIWIYTLHGMFKYNPAKKEFKKFTVADGIYDNSSDPVQLFNYHDNIYIGYRMAYTSFNPLQADVNTNDAVPYITSVSVNKKFIREAPLAMSSFGSALSYDKNNIEFNYTAIDYTNSEKITFAYMLEGFDKDWTEPSLSRIKNYTNLPAGHYTFKVKAFNSNNVQGKNIAIFSFTIRPPFWKTWWFTLLAILFSATALLMLFRQRINQFRKKQQEQNKLQQLELEKYKQQLEFEQIINFFSGSLADKNSKEEVIWDVAKNLIHKLGFANCMIYLWNDDKTMLLQKAGYGPNGTLENVVKEPFNAELWQGIVGHVAATKKPILLGDTSQDPRYRADVLNRYSELCVPALYNGELISVIDSEDFAKDYFTQRHLQLLTTIATLMAARLVSIDAAEDIRRKKEEINQMNEQVAQLELASLRSQMNPHFIFNSLNSVQKYIWENKEEDAAEYLAKFAKLMRAILENSRKDLIPLREEIDVLKIYTELEHRRSNGRFEYSIKISENIDPQQTAIPPMLLQPFIENAIWHGLNKKESTGHLFVSITKKENQLICVVDDDGVGRGKQIESPEKKSMAIDITQQRIDRIIETTRKKAKLLIEDKAINGAPAGTKVTIILPIQTF